MEDVSHSERALFNLTGRIQRAADFDGYAYARAKIAEALTRRSTSLSLVALGLEEIPPEIAECHALTRVSLANNKLERFPDAIWELKNIKSLNVNNNNIKQIPPHISYLSELVELLANNNNITYVSDKISALKNMLSLDLSNNHLANIPNAICNFPNLIYLALDNNNIEVVPENLANLRKLRSLSLGYNKISELAENIGMIASLEILDLQNNYITKVPASVSYMKKIQRVWLDENPLLPEYHNLIEIDGIGRDLSKKTARRLQWVRNRERGDIPRIPPAKPGPRFILTDSPSIDMAEPAADTDIETVQSLIPMLRIALDDLIESCRNSNQFHLIYKFAFNYQQSIGDEQEISIDSCFTLGLRLSNARQRIKEELEEEKIFSMPSEIAEAVDSVLSLHTILISGTDRGRHLIELSNEYQNKKADAALKKTALMAFSQEVERRADLFSTKTREIISQASDDLTLGTQLYENSSEASRTTFNLLSTIGRVVVATATFSVSALAGQAIVASQSGTEIVTSMAYFVDNLAIFVIHCREILVQLAFAGGTDFHWLTSLVDWIERKRKL